MTSYNLDSTLQPGAQGSDRRDSAKESSLMRRIGRGLTEPALGKAAKPKLQKSTNGRQAHPREAGQLERASVNRED